MPTVFEYCGFSFFFYSKEGSPREPVHIHVEKGHPTGLRFDQDSMWVDISDGRIVGVPLAWSPRLLHATAEQREQVRITSRGLHWKELHEDISLDCLLSGEGDLTQRQKIFAY